MGSRKVGSSMAACQWSYGCLKSALTGFSFACGEVRCRDMGDMGGWVWVVWVVSASNACVPLTVYRNVHCGVYYSVHFTSCGGPKDGRIQDTART